jgi:hypothetical protein
MMVFVGGLLANCVEGASDLRTEADDAEDELTAIAEACVERMLLRDAEPYANALRLVAAARVSS